MPRPPPFQIVRLATTTFFSKLQQFLAHSFAISHTLNSRNIEHDWYGFWNHVLLDMVKDTRNLIICPQYVVWVAPENLLALNDGIQDIEPKSGSGKSGKMLQAPQDPAIDKRQTRSMTKKLELDAELKKLMAKSPVPEELKSSIEDSDVTSVIPRASEQSISISSNPSVSSTTSTRTVSLPQDSSTRIADFAIIKVHEHENALLDPVKAEDVEAESIEVKAIVEIKRFASRRLKEEELIIQTNKTILHATTDASIQAALLFEKYKDSLDSVIAIAASGHYWSHTVLRRNNINPSLLEKLSIDFEYQDTHVGASWCPAMVLDSAPSWEELRQLFNTIRA